MPRSSVSTTAANFTTSTRARGHRGKARRAAAVRAVVGSAGEGSGRSQRRKFAHFIHRKLHEMRRPALQRASGRCMVKMAFVTLHALERRDATLRPRGRCAWQGYRPPRDSGPASRGAFLAGRPRPSPVSARSFRGCGNTGKGRNAHRRPPRRARVAALGPTAYTCRP